MRRYKSKIIWVICLLIIFSSTAVAQKKLAQTGFQFLSVATDARGGALADAMTTAELQSAALFFNPAGMARMPGLVDVTATQNQWIADITHNAYSAAFRPAQGRYGVFGLTAMSVDYGEVQGTMVWNNAQGFIDTEMLRPSAFAVGVGYATALSDKFAVGGQAKYTGQHLGKNLVPVGEDSLAVRKNLAFATAFDFGTIYQTGFESLVFGMSVRNFSNEIQYEKEGFQLPLTFRIGVAMDVWDLWDRTGPHGLRVSVDAVHPRSYPEQVQVGMEYQWLETLALRLGYFGNRDEEQLTYGFGVEKFGVGFNYAYTPFGVFDQVQRFTIHVAL